MAKSLFTEHKLQVGVAVLLDHYADLGYLAWSHPPNEAKRSFGLANKLKVEGLKSGESDCIIYPKGSQSFFIELKEGNNKLNKNQVERKRYLEERGFKYYVVNAYTPQEAQNQVETILRKEGVIN